jgi:CRP/FNR family transcriptional regulator
VITDETALELLSATPLFAGFEAAELEPVLKATRRRRYPRDTFVFREGDVGTDLFVIASGDVKIARTTESGTELGLAVLGPGAVFGELGILDEAATRTADAVTLTAAECLVLGRPALVAFLDSHPRAMWRLVAMLSAYIRRQDEAAAELAFLDIPGRVAHKLLELAGQHGEPAGNGTRIAVPVSQRTLAGLVGASRENVNRALRTFTTLGAIRVDKGCIVVLKPDVLERRR